MLKIYTMHNMMESTLWMWIVRDSKMCLDISSQKDDKNGRAGTTSLIG